MTKPPLNLVLVGAGKMGTAMLSGWLRYGVITPQTAWVMTRSPCAALQGQQVHINTLPASAPDVVVIAVKPHMVHDALQSYTHWSNGKTLFISVAAGVTLAALERSLGTQAPIIRAMPNTPASIGAGMTAFIGSTSTTKHHQQITDSLLSAIGETVALDHEDQMDIITGISGSGPAYIFHMIEALTSAGQTHGLSESVAMKLATQTVYGAGALAHTSPETASTLRKNVTSPGGTTQAGLSVLMDTKAGLQPLINDTVKAAALRSKELANE